MEKVGRFRGWRMVGLAFLVQNIAVGVFYGSFGSIVGALEKQIGMSRAQSSAALSISLLTLALSALISGSLLAKRNLRWWIVGGLVAEALSFLTLGFTKSWFVYLAAFGVIGVNLGISYTIAILLLISRWFNAKRGLALGIMSVPVMLPLSTVGAAWLVGHSGVRVAMAVAAGLVLVVAVLVALLLVERPEDIGQQPLGHESGETHAAALHGGGNRLGLLADPRFWMLAVGSGILNGMINVLIAHLVPFGTESGLSLEQASTATFAFGLAGLVGTTFCGWISDKFGGLVMLILMAGLGVVFWTALSFTPPRAVILLLCVSYGVIATGVSVGVNVACGELFGQERIGQAVGTIVVIQLPIMMAAPLVTGMLRMSSGSYVEPFQITAIACAFAGLLLAATIAYGRRGRRLATQA